MNKTNKMKKILGMVLAFSILMGCLPIMATAEENEKYGDYLYYAISNGRVTITDCDDTVTEVDIPNEINGVPVTDIGGIAFAGCVNLKSITIPKNVRNFVGEGSAFYGCSGLTNISIPPNMTNISDDTFRECRNLKSIIIPEGVTNIGKRAFYNCDGLRSIVIPKTVKSIDENAFFGCENLTDVYYKAAETNWEEIKLGNSNKYYLVKKATIHYNYSGSITPTPTPVPTSPCFTILDGEVTNVSNKEQNATIIIAEYDDGRLKSIGASKETFDVNETKTFDISESGKIFVWDSLSGMKPLAE